MADVFQESSGIHRWSSKYKSDMAKPIFSKTVELNDLPASTMGGERQYSVKNELEYSAVRGFPINLRVRNGARTRRAKRVSMEQLDEIIEKQDIRLDAYSGGDGGELRDAKVMNKDKEISKEYKKEEKTDMAVANVVNVSGPSGAFQGGNRTEDALKGKYRDPKDSKKKPLIRLVKSQ